MYPVLQALDEEYLGVDAQFGGVDQRKIFMFAAEYLPKIGYKKRVHLMNSLVPGLSVVSLGEKKDDEIFMKMSSSNEKSKINILDGKNKIRKKINSAYCLEGDADDNTLMILLDKVIFPILNRLGKSFVIQKPDKFGGKKIIYNTYEEVVGDFKSCKLHPGDFKLGISNMLIYFLEPIRTKFADPELKSLVRKAYK